MRVSLDDQDLRYWMIRNEVEARLFGKELTDEQLIEKSITDRQFDKNWIQHAQDVYGVAVTSEEIDQYIS